uniref:DB domain-containing protein n=1 Tax=Panagrellus redivivus TaxID=6233 RepID=A0A7E4UUZ5_PANRE
MEHTILTIIALISLSPATLARHSPLPAPNHEDSGEILPSTIEAAEPLCGTAESDYAPCLSRERADSLFSQCCELHAPAGCRSLCTYESDEATARNALMEAVESGKCKLREVSSILYCASQNQDNKACCAHLGLADPRLNVGDRCLRFCDPAGENGITSITRKDVVCLFNWNVISYCAHSGIPFEK